MNAARQRPRVYSIPPGTPFLPTLADAILSGKLARHDRDDPLALAEATILLPTRRAVRALREVLIAKLGGEAAILPTIRPIGDVDEEDHLLAPTVDQSADGLALPASISRLARHLILTRLTLEWGNAARSGQASHDAPTLIPATAADAARLADDLARLMDDLTIAGLGFDAIEGLAADDQTGYFQITLDFLKIVVEHWPRILATLNRVDPVARRDLLIGAETERLAGLRPTTPLIAAGSTGSIPATAKLLATIARLPEGAVVLPGLDRFLDEPGYDAIGDAATTTAAAYGHPQFGLKKLLTAIGVTRDDVDDLGQAGSLTAARAKLVSEVMRPASTTDNWAGVRQKSLSPHAIESALADVGLVVARNEHEEALAIALAFRQALEDPGTTAALVTPDRELARRVAVELSRWQLTVDDSAGKRLDRLPPGVLARLLTELAASGGDPVALLAVLKHPLAAFGMSRPACRRAARALEVGLLRGSAVVGDFDRLREALAAARTKAMDPETRYMAAARRRLADEDWQAADRLLAAVEQALAPLHDVLGQGGQVSVGSFAVALCRSLGVAGGDDSGGDVQLWAGEAGQALARFLEQLVDEGDSLTLPPAEASVFLATLMAGVAVNPPLGGDRRVHIWGTLEGRLQSVDLLVLGGLDEGIWPAETRTDPWLSRSMRAEIGLEPPERRIGLAAHDFAQGFANARVLITRAEKRAGTPTVASRWLQRLSALIGEAAEKQLSERGETYLNIARRLDRAYSGQVTPVARPEPTPPVAARPRRLSITEIETLIRDPYAIYAKHVLQLDPVDPLGAVPDYALRGILIHDTLGTFTQSWSTRYDEDAAARLIEIGRRVLAQIAEYSDVHAVWSHRFGVIARWFIDWERDRDGEMAQRHAEISGSLDIPAPAGAFRLRGRADRIDRRKDGSLDIFDFKTGAPPTARQVLAGLAPQLALEVAMARLGAFGDDFAGRLVAHVGWLALGQAGRGDPFRSAIESDLTAEGLGDEALARLTALVAAYDEESRAYVSRARPMFETRFESPYDHLARVREWALVESDTDLP